MKEKKHANSLKTNDDNPKKKKTKQLEHSLSWQLSNLETFWIVRQDKQLHVSPIDTKIVILSQHAETQLGYFVLGYILV